MTTTTKVLFMALLLVGGLLPTPLAAELCVPDPVPAATLLLPYFEVALPGPGITTLFSINNARAEATLAHVTLWTDLSVPTLDFDVYLTGYDVVTINLYDVFQGYLPVTADVLRDPTDTISPRGVLSQDVSFAGCAQSLPFTNPALGAILRDHLEKIHTGEVSPLYARAGGLAYPAPKVARGYVTVDVVNLCNLEFVGAPGYFNMGGTGIASNDNVLWGDYFFVDPARGFAGGDTLVHIEACDEPSVGQGSDDCPFVAGDYTFYGRHVAASAVDGREPLGTTFATRYFDFRGPSLTAVTRLIVWRDSKTMAATGLPSWLPLQQEDVVAFDEQENPTNLCFRNSPSPIGAGPLACFPAEAQLIELGAPSIPGAEALVSPPAPFGWLYLNLNSSVSGGLYNPTAQAFVAVNHMAAVGSGDPTYAGFYAVMLDSACDTIDQGVILLTP